MELLRGTAPRAYFVPPTEDSESESVTYSVNGSTPVTVQLEDESDIWEIQLPYIGSDVNHVEVVWSFSIPSVGAEVYSETDSFEAVTPYLSKREMAAVHPNISEADYEALEASVRTVINSYTGQKFGLDVNKTLTVEGHGESALFLPERLVRLSGVATLSAHLDPRSVIIVSDGWYLKKGWSQEVTPRPSDTLFWGYSTGTELGEDEPGYESVGHGNVIVAPGGTGTATMWRDDYPFDITGDWGYESIPASVKEAAKLLANDYACMETAYRDRYLKSIRAADWRLEFSSKAWDSTGNVRADQLLDEFVLLEWAIV